MNVLLANRNVLTAFMGGNSEDDEMQKEHLKHFNKWTGKSKTEMFKDVLKYPKEYNHLNLFDKNPHPDIIPDKEWAIYEAMNRAKQEGREKYAKDKIYFELVKQALESKLTDFEKQLLTLPEILQQEIDSTTDVAYKKTLIHLRDSFYSYFSSSTDKRHIPPIQWIDYDFATSSPLAQEAIKDLTSNLYNDKALENIEEKLKKAGAFDTGTKYFYLWNTDPYNWDDMSYQSRPVEWDSLPNWPFMLKTVIEKVFHPLKEILIDRRTPSSYPGIVMPANTLPDQYAALGNFTINALPEGYVESKGNGKYDICFTKMYYFVNDSFNFEEDAPLWWWRLNDPASSTPDNTSIEWLRNSTFRKFAKHGYGRDLPVLSRLHEVENFQPKCIPYPFIK